MTAIYRARRQIPFLPRRWSKTATHYPAVFLHYRARSLALEVEPVAPVRPVSPVIPVAPVIPVGPVNPVQPRSDFELRIWQLGNRFEFRPGPAPSGNALVRVSTRTAATRSGMVAGAVQNGGFRLRSRLNPPARKSEQSALRALVVIPNFFILGYVFHCGVLSFISTEREECSHISWPRMLDCRYHGKP